MSADLIVLEARDPDFVRIERVLSERGQRFYDALPCAIVCGEDEVGPCPATIVERWTLDEAGLVVRVLKVVK